MINWKGLSVSGKVRVRRALVFFFFSSRRRHTRSYGDWSSDVCSSDLMLLHDARRETRLDGAGDIVLLEDQDRARWDRAQIRSEERRVGKECRSRWGPDE